MFDEAKGVLGALLARARADAPHLLEEITHAERLVGEALDVGKAAQAAAPDKAEGTAAAIAGQGAIATASTVSLGSTLLTGASRIAMVGLEAVIADEFAPVLGPVAPLVANRFVVGGAAAIASLFDPPKPAGDVAAA